MEINLRQELNKYGVSLKKAYGQNFLSDFNLLNEIVDKAGVTDKDTVLEIGCGAGTLTRAIASKAKKVVGYEIDKTLAPILKGVTEDNPNVTVIFRDVMKEKLSDIEDKLGEDYIIVANLPYYITTPIVMRFLENSNKCKALVIMVQEEVADRFCSTSGNTEYGAITVGINLRGSAEKLLRVTREAFTPPPKVDSAVIKIQVDKNKFKGENLDKIRKVVKVAFSSRRKMLINNLINLCKLSRADAEKILLEAGVSLTARAEELTAEDYVNLSKYLEI